jgi:hypothetical protein
METSSNNLLAPLLTKFFLGTTVSAKLKFTLKLPDVIQIKVSQNHGTRGSGGAIKGGNVFKCVFEGKSF